jgi:SAM-dependent methyltransferase
MDVDNCRLYADLAKWWPLFSPPVHYVEEADDLLPDLERAAEGRAQTLLELGAGAGSLASHLKGRFTLTLTDRSPQMQAVSRAVNPECEHLIGDMRTLDLGREFDLVFVHDAIMYAADRDSLRATIQTAAHHCRPGGGVVLVPDHVRETFEPGTDHGGEDGADGRGLRYLEWSWDPDPADETYDVAYAFVLRESDGTVSVEGDRHRHGCFPREVWLTFMREAGLSARVRADRWRRDVFIGRKLR